MNDHWYLLSPDPWIIDRLSEWVLWVGRATDSPMVTGLKLDPGWINLRVSPDWLCTDPGLYTGFIEALRTETDHNLRFYGVYGEDNYPILVRPDQVEHPGTLEFQFADLNEITVGFPSGKIYCKVITRSSPSTNNVGIAPVDWIPETQLVEGFGPVNYSKFRVSPMKFPKFIREGYYAQENINYDLRC